MSRAIAIAIAGAGAGATDTKSFWSEDILEF